MRENSGEDSRRERRDHERDPIQRDQRHDRNVQRERLLSSLAASVRTMPAVSSAVPHTERHGAARVEPSTSCYAGSRVKRASIHGQRRRA